MISQAFANHLMNTLWTNYKHVVGACNVKCYQCKHFITSIWHFTKSLPVYTRLLPWLRFFLTQRLSLSLGGVGDKTQTRLQTHIQTNTQCPLTPLPKAVCFLSWDICGSPGLSYCQNSLIGHWLARKSSCWIRGVFARVFVCYVWCMAKTGNSRR